MKIMKKFLSLTLALAMVVSMFASVATAAEMTAQEKFDALSKKGIFTGVDSNNNPGFDLKMKRVDFATVVMKLTGIQAGVDVAFVDVTDKTQKPIVSAVATAGYMVGSKNNKGQKIFRPGDTITVEEMLKVLVEVLKLDAKAGVQPGTSKWAEGYVFAAVKAGLVPATLNFKDNATRTLLVEATYAAEAVKNPPADNTGGTTTPETPAEITVKSAVAKDAKTVEVTFSDDKTQTVTLETALESGKETEITVKHNDKELKAKVTYTAKEVAVKEAKQTGIKTITVMLDGALTEAKAAVLKKGTLPYSTTAKWNDAKTELTLTTDFILSAGEYTVEVEGLKAASVTIAEEKATSLSINNTNLQAGVNNDLDIVLKNQFEEKMTLTASDLTITAYSNAGTPTLAGLKVDLTNTTLYKKDVVVVLSVIHGKSTLTASKSFTLVDKAVSSKIALGDVVIAQIDGKDAPRAYVGKSGHELKYTLEDQYTATKKLPVTNANADNTNDSETIDGVKFTTSNVNIVDPDSFSVDSDGKLTFSTGATDGTVTIYAQVVATGVISSKTIVVNKLPEVKKLTISNPTSIIVAGEATPIPYEAMDQFDQKIATKDFGASNQALVTFASSNPTVLKLSDIAWVSNEIHLTPSYNDGGTAVLYVYVNNILQNNISLEIKAKAKATRITEVKDVAKLLENTATTTINKDNVKVIDQYNRAYTLTANDMITVAKADANISRVNVTGTEFSSTGSVTITGTSTVGTQIIKLAVKNVDGSSIDYEVGSIASADVKSYSLEAIPTLYAFSINASNNTYAKKLVLVGATSTGQKVALATGKINLATSDNTTENSGIFVEKVGDDWHVFAKSETDETAKIQAFDSTGLKLAELTVNASKNPPVPTKVTLSKESETVSQTASAVATIRDLVTVKDQYDVTHQPSAVGNWFSSDSTVLEIGVGTGLVTGKNKTGEVTITYITQNGISTQIKVTVN